MIDRASLLHGREDRVCRCERRGEFAARSAGTHGLPDPADDAAGVGKPPPAVAQWIPRHRVSSSVRRLVWTRRDAPTRGDALTGWRRVATLTPGTGLYSAVPRQCRRTRRQALPAHENPSR